MQQDIVPDMSTHSYHSGQFTLHNIQIASHIRLLLKYSRRQLEQLQTRSPLVTNIIGSRTPITTAPNSSTVCFIATAGRGGWNNKFRPAQKNRMSVNILRQEELIAQKKREIEAKMAEQAKKKSLQTPNKPLPPRYSISQSSETLQIPLIKTLLNPCWKYLILAHLTVAIDFDFLSPQFTQFTGTLFEQQQVCERWKLLAAVYEASEGQTQL